MNKIASFCDNKFNGQTSLSLSRHSYDGLDKKLKEVFNERSGILHQLSKTSKELNSLKGNLQVGVLLSLSFIHSLHHRSFQAVSCKSFLELYFPLTVFIFIFLF